MVPPYTRSGARPAYRQSPMAALGSRVATGETSLLLNSKAHEGKAPMALKVRTDPSRYGALLTHIDGALTLRGANNPPPLLGRGYHTRFCMAPRLLA